MHNHNLQNCPRCRLQIDEERLKVQPTICGSCGYVVSSQNHAELEKKMDRNNRWLIIAISSLLLVGFLNLSSWGTDAATVRWIQFKDLTGFVTASEMERLGKICLALKKNKCVEYTFVRQAQLDKTRTSRLAEYQMSRRKFKEAATALGAYLKGEKKMDRPAMALYARALSQTGQIDEATKYYEKLLSTKARTLQPELVRNYVTDLARHKRYTAAQAVILRMRRNARSDRFMEQEFRLLDATNTGRETASQH